jgi:hypothetical protein
MPRLHKDVAALVKTAAALGFNWDGTFTGSGHIKLRSPKGFVIISQTPRNDGGRWSKNAVRDMRNLGNRKRVTR